MKTKAKKTRVNRFVRLLSLIYDIDYKIVYRIYKSFDGCVGATKMKLSAINKAAAELDHINDINLSY